MPVRLAPLLFPENDPRLSQIIRRELDRDFVARHDPDEMLAHLAGNVRQDVALAGEIDPKHRPGNYLGHRSFHHDLFFLRHGAEIYSQQSAPQGGSRSPQRDLNAFGERIPPLSIYWTSSSETVGKYSPSSSRFHQAP